MKAYSRLGRLVALGFAGLTLTFLYFFRSKVAYLYGNDAEFIRLTSHFLSFALMFQLADAFTAPIQGDFTWLQGYDCSIYTWFGCLLVHDLPSRILA